VVAPDDVLQVRNAGRDSVDIAIDGQPPELPISALRNLAYEFHQEGRNDRAVQILEGALPKRPKDRVLLDEIGQYQALLKQPKAAAPL